MGDNYLHNNAKSKPIGNYIYIRGFLIGQRRYHLLNGFRSFVSLPRHHALFYQCCLLTSELARTITSKGAEEKQ